MADLDYEGFWKETLIQLQNDLGEEEFSGWFSELKYLRTGKNEKTGENSIVVGIPSTFHRDKVKSRYQNAINSKLKELSGIDIIIEYEITGKTVKEEPASQIQVKKDASTSASQEKTRKPKEKHPQLRDDFVFNTFVIGDTNGFAANAAIAISKNPGKAYNPFLIFGGVGMGKTHLMQAIGNYIHDNSDNKVIYITSENFLNEYVQAIQDGKMNHFKNKFRNTDVLLIDDIQFFQNKDRIQEELFHTFNALLDSKKQLVFTCDRPVSELKSFSARLQSRFEHCLPADMKLPRYEERCAILKKAAESKNASIPIEVIQFVSQNITSNVRDLVSALTTLIAYTELMGKPIDIEIAQQRLNSVINAPKQANLSMDIIIRAVAEHFRLTPNDLKGKKRNQSIVFPRQLAMYISREITDYSTTEIGQEFGGRDHSTVLHSVEKIQGQLLTDPTLDSTIEIIKSLIKEYNAKR
ncbi:MAG: chromosomal replication initiator protein DnaA [Treponema sp.]|jgi:chromosomal replication initiator protein|nr:chromosomal replication initiator protein DnaA [Treponema sp.]